MKNQSWTIQKHSQVTLGWILLVILWGAWVRITGSGAGCGEHWPLCNGVVIPQEPQIKTLIELTHRLTSGIALVLGTTLYWRCRKHYELGNPVRRAAGNSLMFLIFEALIGAAIVLLGWVANNPSLARAISSMLHLVNTFTLVAWLTLTTAWASGVRVASWKTASPLQKRVAALGLTLLLLSGATGAIAALGNTLFPVGTLAEGFEQDLDPASHFLLRLRVSHPLVAVATAVVLWFYSRKIRDQLTLSSERLAPNALIIILGLQISLGFFNLALLAPGWLQLTHLFVANAVWIAFVLTLNFWMPRSHQNPAL
jgi:heme A synthase